MQEQNIKNIEKWVYAVWSPFSYFKSSVRTHTYPCPFLEPAMNSQGFLIIFSNIFFLWELERTFVNLKFFEKSVIHIVELDELFPKIWGLTLKTASGRCGAHENNANSFWDQPVTWCISDQFSDRAQAVLRSRIQIIGNSSYKLYKMYYLIIYYTLFSKNFKFTKVISSSQRKNYY